MTYRDQQKFWDQVLGFTLDDSREPSLKKLGIYLETICDKRLLEVQSSLGELYSTTVFYPDHKVYAWVTKALGLTEDQITLRLLHAREESIATDLEWGRTPRQEDVDWVKDTKRSMAANGIES